MSPPTAPSKPVINYQGVWQVEYRITACAGERHCDLRIGTTGQFLLRLSQGNDTHVTGVLAGPITVDAEGSVSPDGELTLTGASPVQTPQLQSVELTRFNARLTADASLSGTFEYVRPNSAQLGLFGNLVLGGQITGAVRLEPTSDSRTHDGTWAGDFIVVAHSPTEGTYCLPPDPGDVYALSLTLTQSGDEVTGELAMYPTTLSVEGRASGASLTLEGSGSHVISGGTEVLRITRWATTRDVVGRMTGSFSYMKTEPFTSVTGVPLSCAYDAELLSVVLRH